jgi:hypothetical protein
MRALSVPRRPSIVTGGETTVPVREAAFFCRRERTLNFWIAARFAGPAMAATIRFSGNSYPVATFCFAQFEENLARFELERLPNLGI